MNQRVTVVASIIYIQANGNAFRSLLHNLCCVYAVKVNEHDACLAHTISLCWTNQKTLYG